MIQSSSLFFCRLDKFEDKLEGTQPPKSREFAVATENPWQVYERMKMDEYLRILRNLTFVNCWHINECQNEFMWKNYANRNNGNGIAIQTTFENLQKAITDNRKISALDIKYVDFKTHYQEYFLANPFEFIALKDKSQFSAENELRLITVEDVYPQVDDDDIFGWKEQNSHLGERIKVDMGILVQNIFISPFGEKDLLDNVCKLLSDNQVAVQPLFGLAYK